MKRILSLGAGVQSTCVALLAKHGEIPQVDAAIFADTGWEPQVVYRHLEWLETGADLPFPVYRVEAVNLRESVIQASRGESGGVVAIPYHIDGGGIGARQCTHRSKLVPLYRKARELAGLHPGQRTPGDAPVVEFLIGISTDEAHRAKDSRDAWSHNSWPLLDLGMSRSDCLRWIAEHGYPTPPRSSCIGCPFHSDAYWRALRDHSPAEFGDAVQVDEAMRACGGMAGMRRLQFMHKSRRPLGSVVFEGDGQLEFEGVEREFDNECEGLCGT